MVRASFVSPDDELGARLETWRYEPVLHAIKRYAADVGAHEVLIVSPTADPTMRVERIEFDTPFVILDGIDADGHDTRLIQHVEAFSVRMVAKPKPADPEPRGVFGFLGEVGER